MPAFISRDLSIKLLPTIHKPVIQSSPVYPAAQEQPIGSGPQINALLQSPEFERQNNEPWAPQKLLPKPV